MQKVCAFFAAMGQFAQALRQQGHHVLYQTLDDTAEYDSLETFLTALCMRFEVEYFDYLQPDEYRVSKQLRELALPAEVQKQSVDSEHFLLPLTEIDRHFTTGKPARMETFYRSMRRRLNLLMDDDEPEGGAGTLIRKTARSSAQRLSPSCRSLCCSAMTSATFYSGLGDIRLPVLVASKTFYPGRSTGNRLMLCCNFSVRCVCQILVPTRMP